MMKPVPEMTFSATIHLSEAEVRLLAFVDRLGETRRTLQDRL